MTGITVVKKNGDGVRKWEQDYNVQITISVQVRHFKSEWRAGKAPINRVVKGESSKSWINEQNMDGRGIPATDNVEIAIIIYVCDLHILNPCRKGKRYLEGELEVAMNPLVEPCGHQLGFVERHEMRWEVLVALRKRWDKHHRFCKNVSIKKFSQHRNVRDSVIVEVANVNSHCLGTKDHIEGRPAVARRVSRIDGLWWCRYLLASIRINYELRLQWIGDVKVHRYLISQLINEDHIVETVSI